MTNQAKKLKEILKRNNISNENGKLSVTTVRTYRGKGFDNKPVFEFGKAVSCVRALMVEEINNIKYQSSYISVSNFPEYNTCIIKL